MSTRTTHRAQRDSESVPSPRELEQALLDDPERALEVRPKLMSAQRASAYTGIPAQTLIDMANRGDIAYVKFPSVRRWRFRVADLDAAIEKHTHRAKRESTIGKLSIERELELVEGRRPAIVKRSAR